MLVFVRDGDIWTMNGDGTSPTNLTLNLGFESNPAWSSDGSQIVFVSSPDNSCWYPDPPCRYSGSDVYVVSRDGTGIRRITTTDQDEANPAWEPTSPAASAIVAHARAKLSELSAHDLDLRPQRRLGVAPQRQVLPVCARSRRCVPK